MKNIYLLLVFLASAFSMQLFPQTSEPIKIDAQASKFDFEPGVVLMRLKDDAIPVIGKTSAGAVTMGIASVDVILFKYQATSSKKLFPDAPKLTQMQMLKLYNGKTFQRPSLHNIYKITIKDPKQTLAIINELKNNPNVIYAEPDYIYSVVDDKPESPVMTEKEAEEWVARSKETEVRKTEYQSTTKLNTNSYSQ